MTLDELRDKLHVFYSHLTEIEREWKVRDLMERVKDTGLSDMEEAIAEVLPKADRSRWSPTGGLSSDEDFLERNPTGLVLSSDEEFEARLRQAISESGDQTYIRLLDDPAFVSELRGKLANTPASLGDSGSDQGMSLPGFSDPVITDFLKDAADKLGLDEGPITSIVESIGGFFSSSDDEGPVEAARTPERGSTLEAYGFADTAGWGYSDGDGPANLFPDSAVAERRAAQQVQSIFTNVLPSSIMTSGQTVSSRNPTESDMDAEIDRYFTGTAGFPDDAEDRYSFMETNLMSGPGNWWDQPGGTSEDAYIYDLVAQGGGVRGMLNRAIELQWSDPDAVIGLQMQLMQHGFFTDGQQPQFGEIDGPTRTALMNLSAGKWLVDDNLSFADYLADARHDFQILELQSMDDKLAEFDATAAEELKALRNNIETMDLSVALSDPVGLNEDIQAEAVRTIGRRLSQAEVDGLIGNIHQKERDDYYVNSPEYREYQRRVRMLELAATQLGEEREAVMSGQRPADLDQFMMAISAQESGGNPNALNPDSGAFGIYQFMPATWAHEARLSGLDPSDKSAENQHAMARHMASRYFNMFGNWRDASIAWYAGPGSSAIGTTSVGTSAASGGYGGQYPSIQRYADEITQRMQNGGQLDVDQAWAAADAGSLGGATASQQGLGPEELSAWWNERKAVSESMSATAGGLAAATNAELTSNFQAPGVGERTLFDAEAYLRRQVEQAGGVDTDAFRFAQMSQNWFDALGAR